MMSKPLELVLVSQGNTVFDRIEEYCRVCLKDAQQHTRDAAVRHLLDFNQYLIDYGMDATSLNGYELHLEKTGLSRATVKNRFRDVRSFLKWCWRMKYTKEPWFDYLPKLKPTVWEEPKIVTHTQYLLLRELAKTDKDMDWMLVLGYHTGMRMGDCCHLRWSQIDRRTQVISLVVRKSRRSTGKKNYIPYASGTDLHQMIEQRWLTRDKEIDTGMDFVSPVFAMYYTDGNGTTVPHIFGRLFRKAKLKGLSFKHLRSTFETRLANSGANLSLAMAVTGRSSMNTLARYVRVDHAAAREAVGKALDLHNTSETFK